MTRNKTEAIALANFFNIYRIQIYPKELHDMQYQKIYIREKDE